MRFKGKHYVSKRDLKEDRFQQLVERAMEYYYRDRQRVWIGAAAVVAVVVIAIVLLQNRKPGVNLQAQMAFTEAVGMYSNNDFGRAETVFTDIATRYGGDFAGAKAHFYLANIYYNTNRLPDAKREFGVFLSRVKNDPLLSPSAQFGIGNCEEQSGNNLGAAKSYEAVWQRWPKSPLAYDAMMAAGRAYRDANDFAKAEAIYQELLTSKPAGEKGEDVKIELARIQALQNKFR
ncbi:MAG TPA: tetratricopeptide repeat protein [bacterium]|nr:tetratricopeptide repeat protein [bacterium]